MTLTWGDWIETGVSDIDNDQMELIHIYNELVNATSSDAPINKVRSIISAFCFVYLRHIQKEERLMAAVKYDKIISHKSHHDYFASRLSELEQDDPDLLTTYNKVASIMIEFVAVHLDNYDAPLASFIKSQQLTDVIVSAGTDNELCRSIMSVWHTLLSQQASVEVDTTDAL